MGDALEAHERFSSKARQCWQHQWGFICSLETFHSHLRIWQTHRKSFNNNDNNSIILKLMEYKFDAHFLPGTWVLLWRRSIFALYPSYHLYPQSVIHLSSGSNVDWVFPLLLVLMPLSRLGNNWKPLAPPSGDPKNNSAAFPKTEGRVWATVTPYRPGKEGFKIVFQVRPVHRGR